MRTLYTLHAPAVAMWTMFVLALLCTVLLAAAGYRSRKELQGFHEARDPASACSSECLALLLGDDHPCDQTLDTLTFKAGPEAVRVLVEALRDRREYVQARSADLLARCVVPTALVLGALRRAWKDSGPSVRQHVGKAIFHHLRAVSDPTELQKHHEFMLTN